MAENLLKKMPALRSDPLTGDPTDAERVAFADKLWTSQDALLSERDQLIEDHVRMLAGQHWMFFSPEFNRFVHVSEFLSPSDRMWRQFPVVDLISPWFMLTHSRLTENPPIITFQPSTSDELDAALAETWDVIHKSQWREQDMEEMHDRLTAWLIVAGRAYFKSQIDPDAGEMVPLSPGTFDFPEGVDPEDFAVPRAREGGVRTRVLSSIEVRYEWGPQPFHEKKWHLHRSLHSPSRCKQLWGLDVDPTLTTDDAGDDLSEILFSTGLYGSSSRPFQTHSIGNDEEGLVVVDELWMSPSPFPGMQETDESPGGRLLLRVGDQVAYDGPRPGRFRWCSPLRSHDFVYKPGRPEGSTPFEMLAPIQRAYNRLMGQVMEYVALCSNPKKIVHQSVGIEEWTNEPGETLEAMWMPQVREPIQYLAPPPLPADVYRVLEMLEAKFEMIGSLRGTEGRKPESGISGESVKELRFNADRPLGATAKRMAFEYSRWSLDIMEWLKVLWDAERVIEYAGEDEILKTVTVAPDLWRGRIDVFPDTESMLPEGRGAREERVEHMLGLGMLGDPADPATRRRFLELSRFPHLGRDVEPLHNHRRSAKRMIANVVQGMPADNVPLFRWYDFSVWRHELRDYLASPEYFELDPGPAGQLALLYELILQAEAAQAIEELSQQAIVQDAAVSAGLLPSPDSTTAPPGPQGRARAPQQEA